MNRVGWHLRLGRGPTGAFLNFLLHEDIQGVSALLKGFELHAHEIFKRLRIPSILLFRGPL
jgi:hypothetical protein